MAKIVHQLSYWERESFFKNIDVAIIGSGIVGLAAAMALKRKDRKMRVVVLERGSLPIGASTRNAGFACFGSMTELLSDIEERGEDEVLALVEKRWTGLQRLRKLVGDRFLDFKMDGGHELFTDDDDEIFRKCHAAMPDLNEKIIRITGQKNVFRLANERIAANGFAGVENLILNQAEGQVDTGKMMLAMLEKARKMGVSIFNGVNIEAIEDSASGPVRLETDEGWSIEADQILVAVNGFARKLLPETAVFPARNQVLITAPIPNLKVKGCFHYDRGYYYFRNIDGRILLGGGRNLDFEGEKTDQFGTTDLIKSALVRLLDGVIVPNGSTEIDGWWSGILGLGPEKKPIIERVSPNVAVAVRMNGMGVAIGTLVGQEGADLILQGRKREKTGRFWRL